MLGWRMLKTGDYFLDLPDLTKEEEGIIEEAEERFKEATRESRQESEELIQQIIKEVARDKGLYLDLDQQDYLL